MDFGLRTTPSLMLFALMYQGSFCVSAAPTGPDMVSEAKPLLAELNGPKYSVSRCMLSPVLSADGRVVAKSVDASFVAKDVFIAVDGDVLDATSKTALIDILERRPPQGRVRVRVLRSGSERVIDAKCTDVKPYYSALLDAARAAVANDSAVCADQLEAAARLHALSAVWLRLSMSCGIDSGRLSGAAVWQADYELFRQRILEAQSSPPVLEKIRHGVLTAVRDLRQGGHADLADKLRRQYEAAVAQQTPDRPEA